MTLPALLAARARAGPDRPAVVTARGVLTRADLARRAGAVARALAARGVGPGDRVAVLLADAADLAAALLGGWALGATLAPLNPRLVPEERERVLAHLRPRAVLAEAPPGDAELPAAAEPGGPALVLYTSGTTGAPKGAVLSHPALAAAIDAWAGPVMALSEDDRVLAVLPLAHSFGLTGALLAPLAAGATVVGLDRFAPDPALDAAAAHRITVLPAVATMFRRMLEAPALDRGRLGGLRLAVSGAAPCPWELAEAWRRRTGVRILRGYGMTELFRPISYLAREPADLPGAIGRAVPGVEVRVVDEAGTILGPDAVGELLIRTPAAMDHYLDADADTRAVLEAGWFRTGDLARVSADGWVTIVGRKKDLILRGGYSVVPHEVEAVLLAHPTVAEAAVIGVPSADLGEEIAAFVTLRPEAARASSADGAGAADTLIAWCRERLAPYKRPRQVSVLGALPRNATGKVLKSELRTPPGS